MFDFSQLTGSIEGIIGMSVGGVSLIAIVTAVIKVVSWLKNNSIEKAVKLVTESIIGKDISVDLTAITIKELNKIQLTIKEQVDNSLTNITQSLNAQAQVLTDLADIQINKTFGASAEQTASLKANTENIRTHTALPAKQKIVVGLKPIEKKVETKKITLE